MIRGYRGFRTPRRKKIRNPIRIKERVAKKGGRCHACRARYEKGDDIIVVNIRRRVFHRHTCVPVDAGQMPATMLGTPMLTATPQAVVGALKSNWTVGEAKLVAIQALENAMVVVAKNTTGITPEMEKAFDKYNKVKSVFMRPGSDNEGRQAARLAILEIVKTFF